METIKSIENDWDHMTEAALVEGPIEVTLGNGDRNEENEFRKTCWTLGSYCRNDHY